MATHSGLVNAAGLPITVSAKPATISSVSEATNRETTGRETTGRETTGRTTTAESVATNAGDEKIICDADQGSFMPLVIEASMRAPVLVDFWAPWCEPCKQYTPLIEAAVLAESGRVRLVKVNVDDNPAIAQQLQIHSLPTTMVFVHGRPVEAIPGVIPRQTLGKLMTNLLKMMGQGSHTTDMEALVQTAEQALTEDPAAALAQFEQILAHDPDYIAAIAGIIRAYIALGDSKQAQAFYDSLTGDSQQNATVQEAYIGIQWASQSQDGANLIALKQAQEAVPDDLNLRFDLAEALISAQQPEAAIDHLLHIIETDRQWQDKKAHQCLLDLFLSLGFQHPLSKSGRQRLSSVLFS